MLSKGNVVMIYQDPLTERKPEGTAKLVNRLNDVGVWQGRNLVRWEVKFYDERTLERGTFERNILEPATP